MSTNEQKNYTPSEWSKRFNESEQLLDHFFRISHLVSEDARKTINNELNIPYGSTNRTKYDIFGTHLPKDAPIFVFIHGGYWQEFHKDYAGFPITSLVSKGIKVIIAGYDLCPQVTMTELVAEIKILAEHVLKLAHENGSKSVWIAGHSAGAHLAATLLYDNNWINKIEHLGYVRLLKGLVLIAGVYDLKPVSGTTYNDALKLTNAEIENFSMAPVEEKNDIKPLLSDVKVVITVGEFDSPIFVEESRRYTKKLVCSLNNVEFLFIKDIDHFDIVENLTKTDFVLTKLIVNNILNE